MGPRHRDVTCQTRTLGRPRSWEARQDAQFRELIAEIHGGSSLPELAVAGEPLDQAGVGGSHYRLCKQAVKSAIALAAPAGAALVGTVEHAEPRASDARRAAPRGTLRPRRAGAFAVQSRSARPGPTNAPDKADADLYSRGSPLLRLARQGNGQGGTLGPGRPLTDGRAPLAWKIHEK